MPVEVRKWYRTSLELELQEVVSYQVGAGKETP